MNRICPRCGKLVPEWQPVHLSCFLARSKYLFLILALVLAMLVLAAYSLSLGR